MNKLNDVRRGMVRKIMPSPYDYIDLDKGYLPSKHAHEGLCSRIGHDLW